LDDNSIWNNLVALHTNPAAWAEEGEELFSSSNAFANSKNIDTQKTRLERQIKLLQDQETAVYDKFFADCKTYDDFIRRLRELFDTKHNVDMQIIQNFAAEKIQVLLDKNFGTQMLPSKNLITEIEIKNPDVTKIDIGNILKGTSGNFKLSNNIIKLDIRMDDAGIKAMKELLNKAQGKHFRTDSLGTDCLKTYLKHLIVEKNLPKETREEKIQAITKGFRTTKFIGDSDLRYTLADIKDPSKKANIRHATKKIKDFFYSSEGLNVASGTRALKKAFQRTWKDNINRIEYGIAFFLKGGTLTYFNGAFGEFQTALLSNYILRRTGIKDSTLASKISNTIGQAEQAKIDVKLLGDLGIQVKNYNPYTYNYNPIETNTTAESFLNKLGNSGQEIPVDDQAQVTSLTSFLANYAFSQDYRAMAGKDTIPSVEEIEKSLENYAGELYNLSIIQPTPQSTAYSDTVLFYSFSGMYLVPASVILQAVYDNLKNENHRTNMEVSIKWKGDGLSSKDMQEKQKDNSPYWTTYWHKAAKGSGYRGSGWSRQPAQDTKIKNLLSVTRIKTGFKVTNGFDNNGKIDIAGRLNLNKYKLFK
jgi:hypothetical protein